MDGLPQHLDLDTTTGRQQQTLKSSIDCVGVGLHSGRRVRLTLRPAEPDHGIIFRRTDLGRDIPARFDRVVDARLATVVADGSASVGTVEHLMAALAGSGID
ncbi:MAG TPA: UDP-3-O-acyl-N-acetylglucosamine deacetylase, partial [Acetobacteraceae bacterium]